MKELTEAPHYKKSTMVSHNGLAWVIVENETEYKLMPWDCLQNGGKPITVPLGTAFTKSIYIDRSA